jgi:hypothetical protein
MDGREKGKKGANLIAFFFSFLHLQTSDPRAGLCHQGQLPNTVGAIVLENTVINVVSINEQAVRSSKQP